MRSITLVSMEDSEQFLRIPGYVSVKDAAKILGLSPRTVYDYVEEGRLPSARLADVIAISVEDLTQFKREPSGRPRKNTPLWRISSGDNEQFLLLILVQLRAGQHEILMQKLEKVRKSKQHIFPGTVMRYVAENAKDDERMIIVLVWRGTILPSETKRAEELEAFQQALNDVVDWTTAEYRSGSVLMHT